MGVVHLHAGMHGVVAMHSVQSRTGGPACARFIVCGNSSSCHFAAEVRVWVVRRMVRFEVGVF